MPPLETLHFATYNVAGLPEGISSSHPSVNSKLISPLLNMYQLVVLQEDFAYHQDIVSALTLPYASAPDTGAQSLGDGLNFVSDYPLSGVTRVQWADCSGVLEPGSGSDCLTPKGFALTTVTLTTGWELDVYDLHADAGSGVNDQAARAKNLMQLAEYINAHSANRAVVVAGDTNARYSSGTDNVGEFVDAVGLTDVWVQLVRDGVRPTPGVPVVCSSDENDPGCEHIDKVFYRNGADVGFTLRPVEYSVDGAAFVDSGGAQLSDHRPVSATFTLQAQ